MFRCIHIGSLSKRESLLLSVIRRTVRLNLIWHGPFCTEAVAMLQSKSFDIVFVSLPSPDTKLPESILEELRASGVLFATSIYPDHLFHLWKLDPLCFLTEPFAVQDLHKALDQHFGKSHIV